MIWFRRQLARVPWLEALYLRLRRYAGSSRIQEFAIAIYRGTEPWAVTPVPERPGPVLTRRHVTDVPAAFVADPFMIRRDGAWFMFLEVMRADTWRGEIAFATSPDGLSWTYGSVVLAEPFHLSYPYVFEADGEVYMVPETSEARSVRLYRAESFPDGWVFVRELLVGERFADASVFQHDGGWWMLVEAGDRSGSHAGSPRHDTLRLYRAPDLLGPWSEHPSSPIVEFDPRIARPAGRVVRSGDGFVRFAQECSDAYGLEVRAFLIEELGPTTYRELALSDCAVLGPGRQRWNRGGMHHIDPHTVEDGWIACVDGWALRFPPRVPPRPHWVPVKRALQAAGLTNLVRR